MARSALAVFLSYHRICEELIEVEVVSRKELDGTGLQDISETGYLHKDARIVQGGLGEHVEAERTGQVLFLLVDPLKGGNPHLESEEVFCRVSELLVPIFHRVEIMAFIFSYD